MAARDARAANEAAAPAWIEQQQRELGEWEEGLVQRQDELDAALRAFRDEMAMGLRRLADERRDVDRRERELAQRESLVAVAEKRVMAATAELRSVTSAFVEDSDDDEGDANANDADRSAPRHLDTRELSQARSAGPSDIGSATSTGVSPRVRPLSAAPYHGKRGRVARPDSQATTPHVHADPAAVIDSGDDNDGPGNASMGLQHRPLGETGERLSREVAGSSSTTSSDDEAGAEEDPILRAANASSPVGAPSARLDLPARPGTAAVGGRPSGRGSVPASRFMTTDDEFDSAQAVGNDDAQERMYDDEAAEEDEEDQYEEEEEDEIFDDDFDEEEEEENDEPADDEEVDEVRDQRRQEMADLATALMEEPLIVNGNAVMTESGHILTPHEAAAVLVQEGIVSEDEIVALVQQGYSATAILAEHLVAAAEEEDDAAADDGAGGAASARHNTGRPTSPGAQARRPPAADAAAADSPRHDFDDTSDEDNFDDDDLDGDGEHNISMEE